MSEVVPICTPTFFPDKSFAEEIGLFFKVIIIWDALKYGSEKSKFLLLSGVELIPAHTKSQELFFNSNVKESIETFFTLSFTESLSAIFCARSTSIPTTSLFSRYSNGSKGALVLIVINPSDLILSTLFKAKALTACKVNKINNEMKISIALQIDFILSLQYFINDKSSKDCMIALLQK